jgi:uncharacterized membrane protein
MSDRAIGASGRLAEGKTANTIYILYLVGLVIGITHLIGVIMAYVNQNDAPDWVKTHYRLQIRTFWIALLYFFAGVVTAFIVIGWFIILFTVVWAIMRCAKGMKFLGRGEPYDNVTSWLW